MASMLAMINPERQYASKNDQAAHFSCSLGILSAFPICNAGHIVNGGANRSYMCRNGRRTHTLSPSVALRALPGWSMPLHVWCTGSIR